MSRGSPAAPGGWQCTERTPHRSREQGAGPDASRWQLGLRAASGERVRPSGAKLPVMRCGSPAGPCPRPVCILCRTFGPATGQAFVAGGVFPGSTEAPTRAELVCLLRGGPRPPRACGGRAGGLGAAR